MDGYVKIHRKLTEWGWYHDINTKVVFLHLLLTANYKELEFQGQIIRRGQVVVSVPRLCEKLGLTPREVRTALDHLASTREISKKTTNRFTLITILKYDVYQGSDGSERQTSDRQTTDKRQSNDILTTDERQSNDILTTTSKERKEIKNKRNKENKPPISPFLDDPDFQEAFAAFAEMRRASRAPLTDRAKDMVLRKLGSLSKNKQEQIRILDQSTLKNWKTVYPLKQESQPKPSYDLTELEERGNHVPEL